jgi:amidase
VLRPAAFCGIVGFKPTYGRISVRGVFPLAPSFDHIGVLCRSVAEAATAYRVLAGYDPLDPFSLDTPPGPPEAALPQPPRFAFARTDCEATATEPVQRHLKTIAALLAEAGATVEDVDLPAGSQAIHDLGQAIFRTEAAASHAALFDANKDDYGPNIRGLVEAGREVRAVEYAQARFELLRLGATFVALLGQFDALLLPTAPTTALRGLEQTGDAVFCAPASFLGLPSISLPSGLADDGLPLAVQLVAGRLAESKLLRVAAWTESLLDFHERPAING